MVESTRLIRSRAFRAKILTTKSQTENILGVSRIVESNSTHEAIFQFSNLKKKLETPKNLNKTKSDVDYQKPKCLTLCLISQSPPNRYVSFFVFFMFIFFDEFYVDQVDYLCVFSNY